MAQALGRWRFKPIPLKEIYKYKTGAIYFPMTPVGLSAERQGLEPIYLALPQCGFSDFLIG